MDESSRPDCTWKLTWEVMFGIRYPRAIAKALGCFDRRLNTLAQDDAVDLTSDLVMRLICSGLGCGDERMGRRDGARYGRSRKSLLSPQIFSGSDGDD